MSVKPLTVPLIAALLLCAPLRAAIAEEPKEDQEPPQILYFELDGRKVPVELNKPFQTEVLGGSKTATLRVEPYREFRYAGLFFHYPREYTFEADFSEPLLTMWTLSGNDCVIAVHRCKNQEDPEEMRLDFAKAMISLHKDAQKNERETTLKLRDATLKGTRLEAQRVGILIQHDVFSFRAGKDSVMLIIQDTPQKNGKASADRARAEEMLRETLALPGK